MAPENKTDRICLLVKYLFNHGQAEKFYYLKPSSRFPFSGFGKYGITPIRHILRFSIERVNYGERLTVFAKIRDSGCPKLPFSKKLLEGLKKSGVRMKFVTLHVGLGTFAPLTEENIRSGKLHGEYYEISRKDAVFLNRAKDNGASIIAVGTTVARTLESASDGSAKLRKLSGSTDIFIRNGYRFGFVDGLITNFHVPKSSLMMLVSAFIGRKNLLSLWRGDKEIQLFHSETECFAA